MKAPHQAITKLEYNPLGELLRSTDPEGNYTDYTYDLLGQLLERDHPWLVLFLLLLIQPVALTLFINHSN